MEVFDMGEERTRWHKSYTEIVDVARTRRPLLISRKLSDFGLAIGSSCISFCEVDNAALSYALAVLKLLVRRWASVGKARV